MREIITTINHKITIEEYCDIYNKYYMFNVFKCLRAFSCKFLDPQSLFVDAKRYTSTFDWLFPPKTEHKPFNNYLLEKYKGQSEKLAYDIIENGMYSPICVEKKDGKEFAVTEGVHRVLSFRFLYSLLNKETDVKMLSIIYPEDINTSYNTKVFGYEKDNTIISCQTNSYLDLIYKTVEIDRELNKAREYLNIKPSKFFTDEKVFKEVIKDINWYQMDKKNESNIIIAK